MSRQILSIGESLDIADKNVKWHEDRNIRDFKIVFANLRSIEDVLEVDYRTSNVIFPTEEEIYDHMQSGNYLFVILPEKRKVQEGEIVLDTVGWIPFNIGLEEESGKSVNKESISEEWKWYFDGSNFNWDMCMQNIGKGILSEDELDTGKPGVAHYEKVFYELESLVMNRYNRCIAGKVSLGFTKVTELNFTDAEPKMDSLDYFDGELYLLPLLNSYEYESLVEGILRNLFGVNLSNEEDTPAWTNEYTVPDENKVTERIKQIDEKISELESERDKKKTELRELRRYKGLLYGNEDFLEELVPEVFGEMGFEVEGEIPHGRDGAIFFDDLMLVLEITGTKGAVSLKKCRQLNSWVDEYRYSDAGNSEKECAGALVINPFREKKPDERTGYIDNNTERFMSDRNHKILTTPALFYLYTEYKKGNISKQEVKEVLTNDETVVNRESLL